MKKRILCCAVLASLAFTMLWGCSGKNKEESSSKESQAPQSSAESKVSKASEASSKKSEEPSKSEESSEIPQPSKPEIQKADAKFWSATELEELVKKSKLENLSVSAAEYVPVTGSDQLYATTAEISITGLFDDVLSMSEYLSKQEKNNVYIESFSLSVDYNDDVNAVFNVVNPYPAGETPADDGLKEYIAIRYNSVDKKDAIAAFIDENSNYYLKTAQCDFTPAEDGSITFLAGVDFSTFNGFVAYRYKLSRSDNFVLSENAAVVEKSEDYYDDKAFHADIILTTNKFNR
ncbi:MAG: hypothetical protein IJU51_00245 [Clostridia bacterium]|nr:hypothetical protein [Clostridia bacterium]